jgi:hypothetical protein
MYHRNILLTLVILGMLLGSCVSQKPIREDIEWSNFRWNHESDKSKPRILFIGNSISLGYVPEITSLLNNIANCDHLATSRCIEDPALFKETKIAMGKYNHAVIHFNNGLHGRHLSNEQYREGLEKYVKFLISHKSRKCILIYSLTTPVSSKNPEIKLDPVRNQVVLDRNRIAMQIMAKYNIPVIDLYILMEPELDSYIIEKGNLHYNKKGYKMMAEKISGMISKQLKY